MTHCRIASEISLLFIFSACYFSVDLPRSIFLFCVDGPAETRACWCTVGDCAMRNRNDRLPPWGWDYQGWCVDRKYFVINRDDTLTMSPGLEVKRVRLKPQPKKSRPHKYFFGFPDCFFQRR